RPIVNTLPPLSQNCVNFYRFTLSEMLPLQLALSVFSSFTSLMVLLLPTSSHILSPLRSRQIQLYLLGSVMIHLALARVAMQNTEFKQFGMPAPALFLPMELLLMETFNRLETTKLVSETLFHFVGSKLANTVAAGFLYSQADADWILTKDAASKPVFIAFPTKANYKVKAVQNVAALDHTTYPSSGSGPTYDLFMSLAVSAPGFNYLS